MKLAFLSKLRKIIRDSPTSIRGLDPKMLYERPDSFFRPTERFFWNLLNQATGTRYRIFGRTRLMDIVSIKPGLPESYRTIAEQQVESRYVDFVLCDPVSLEVAGVIELEDDPYQAEIQRSAKKHDAMTGRILTTAGIPFIRIKSRRDYTALDVKLAIMEKIPDTVSGDVTAKEQPQTDPTGAKLCPACGAPMVKRVVKKGPNIGTEFWGCSAFPKCKTSLSMDDI